MFHLETLARTIHADRVRDMERAANERRLLAPDDDSANSTGADVVRSAEIRPARAVARVGGPVPRTAPCDGSAGSPA